MRTVLFVESGSGGGGSFESLYLLVQALDGSRFRPVVAFLNPTRYLDRFRELGVETHLVFDRAYTVNPPGVLQHKCEKWSTKAHQRWPLLVRPTLWFCHREVVRALARLAERVGADILYSNNNIHRNIFMVELARRTGLPLAAHNRSPGGQEFTPSRCAYAQTRVGAFLSKCRMNYRYWSDLGLDPQRHRMVPNGMPAFDGEPLDLCRAFGIRPGGRVIGCVSRLIGEKGHAFLLRSFARLLREHENVQLLLVGDGPEMETLQALSRELGLDDDVVFAGYDARVWPILASLDLLVQPSTIDSFSRTVLEAMSVGRPVIATDIGGIREAVVSGENGLLVPSGDEAALADAMGKVIEDGELASRLAKGARKTVAEHYDLDRATRRIEAILTALVEGGPLPV